jgi:hypothetical protein
VHARDAVADRDDRAHFGHVDVEREAADLVADDLGNLFCFDIHVAYCPASINDCFILSSCVATLPS